MNNGTATSLFVCVNGRAACVRIVGRANFTSSVDFKRLVYQLQNDGCNVIILDLRECLIMDSTFLGVLAAMGNSCESSRAEGRNCTIELFRPSERVTDLLDNLGVLPLFKLVQETPSFECFRPIDEGDTSKLELTQTCLEAHRTLMATSAENERRFKEATEHFADTLRKHEKPPP
jgi:anti-sigma B factor antagonist